MFFPARLRKVFPCGYRVRVNGRSARKVRSLLPKRSEHLECYRRFPNYRTSHCSLRCNASIPFLRDNLTVEPSGSRYTEFLDGILRSSQVGITDVRRRAFQQLSRMKCNPLGNMAGKQLNREYLSRDTRVPRPVPNERSIPRFYFQDSLVLVSSTNDPLRCDASRPSPA